MLISSACNLSTACRKETGKNQRDELWLLSYPANLCHLMDQLLKSLFLRLDFDEMLKLRVSRRSLAVHVF